VLALVVDDSRAMRMVLRRNLEQLDFTVIEAGNGLEALDAMRSAPQVPDLALVDWNMPEMDGLEFVTAVRAEQAWRSMTVMMVTSESEQSRVVQALTAGAHEYLMKPFQPAAMVDKLGLHGLRRTAASA
jgi:two-component system, chemotaxis family, chemotaxis protein CheY